MDNIIAWSEPEAVFQIEKGELKSSLLPTHDLWLLIAKALCLSVSIIVLILYFIKPFDSTEQFSDWLSHGLYACFYVFLTLLLGIGIPVAIMLCLKTGARHELNSKGLFRHGLRAFKANWEQLESYSILNHSKISGIRVLEFKIRGNHEVRRFSFNPYEVDESEIHAIVEKYCHTRLGKEGKAPAC